MPRSFVAASSQYLERSGAVVSGYPLTLAAWVKPASLSSQRVLSISNGTNGGSGDRVNLGYNSSGAASALTQNGTTNNAGVTSSGLVTVGAWAHLAATFASSADRNVFVNGGNKASGDGSTVAIIVPWDTTSVGRALLGSVGALQYLDGMVAHAGIWSAVLSDAEVAALAAGAPPWKVRPSALVAYWPLHGDASPEPDHSGNKYSLTVTGATKGAGGPRVWLPSYLGQDPEVVAITTQDLAGTPLAGTFALPSAALTPGPVNVAGTALAATAALPGAALIPGAVDLAGSALAGAWALPTGGLAPGACALSGSPLAAAASLPVGELTPGAVDLAGAPLAALWALGAGYLAHTGRYTVSAVITRRAPSSATVARREPASALVTRVAPSSAEVTRRE